MKTKVMAIIGTRPQFLKVSRKWADVIVDTGQHYDEDMSNIHSPGLDYSLGAVALWEMIDLLLSLIREENPDIIVVIGDTRSTYAGAVAAKYCGKFLVHLEAGMRSYDDSQEERIRTTVDRMSDAWLCTSEHCKYNLSTEGLVDNVVIVGDPEFDKLSDTTPHKGKRWENKEKEPYCLLTLHRAELVDDEDRLREVIEAIGETKKRFIFPIHPRTAANIRRFKIKLPPNIKTISPIRHTDFIRLMLHADKVVTDSGGVQREAYWLVKTVIIVREATEHVEIIDKGCGKLTGYKKKTIIQAINKFESSKSLELPLSQSHERIKATLEDIEGLPNSH